ncbi:hypothetical protein HaLaN_17181, partial [Haematococcus lacustris]
LPPPFPSLYPTGYTLRAFAKTNTAGGVKPVKPQYAAASWPAIRSRHRHAVMPPDRGAVTYGLEARV